MPGPSLDGELSMIETEISKGRLWQDELKSSSMPRTAAGILDLYQRAMQLGATTRLMGV
jgi:hypothetical protein